MPSYNEGVIHYKLEEEGQVLIPLADADGRFYIFRMFRPDGRRLVQCLNQRGSADGVTVRIPPIPEEVSSWTLVTVDAEDEVASGSASQE